MDGRQTLKALRQNPDYSNIRVVMYSTTRNELEINEYTSIGVDFLIKPNSYREIMEVVPKYFSNKQ